MTPEEQQVMGVLGLLVIIFLGLCAWAFLHWLFAVATKKEAEAQKAEHEAELAEVRLRRERFK